MHWEKEAAEQAWPASATQPLDCVQTFHSHPLPHPKSPSHPPLPTPLTLEKTKARVHSRPPCRGARIGLSPTPNSVGQSQVGSCLHLPKQLKMWLCQIKNKTKL